MKTARLLFLALMAAATSLHAQTNEDMASNLVNQVSSPAPTTGPVVMPPAASPIASPSVQTPTGPGPKGDEIYDIRPPLFFLHSWLWLWIVLATLAALALLILLWRRFGPGAQLNPKTAYELALEKLERARGLMNEDDPAPYAVAVSEAIRTYLGQRFQSPSTRRTTEEFLRQMEADPDTPLAGHRDLLRDFLQACDLLKFARYRPGMPELEQVQERAASFVTATKPAPEPATREKAEFIPRTA
jgi:hypothetical protein